MLSDFYKSKAWEKLIANIKLQRIDAEGNLICEHCGKPIVKKYDCIGHHKTHLTEQNYNDAYIALNPDNIALVHHRCHNKIHNKLAYSGKQVFIVYGSPLSGKTSWVKDNMSIGDLIVDIDRVWECISGQPQYTKPARLNAVVFSIYNQLIESVKMRNGKWLNAYIVGGFPLISERQRLSRMLGAREIFITTSQAECLDRLHSNPNGRDVSAWEKYIAEWWSKYTPPPSVM